MEAFNIYISSIVLYNCETWTLTHSHENAINSFQRRLLRNVYSKCEMAKNNNK